METVACVSFSVNELCVLCGRLLLSCSRSLSSTSCCLIEIQMRIAFHQTHISLFLFLFRFLFYFVNDDGWINWNVCLHAFVEISLYHPNHFQVGMFAAEFFHKPVSMSHQKAKSHTLIYCIYKIGNWILFCTFFLFLARQKPIKWC